MSVRAALVTGGARRVGAAIVERLASAGYALAIHCGSSRAEAEALAVRLRAGGGTAVVVQGDLADAATCPRLVADAVSGLGGLSLLVNNASTFDRDTLEMLDPAVWDRQFAVNIRAPALLASAFASVAGGDAPSIVNIVDQRVRRLTPQVFSYTLTKAALHAATTTMAQALAPRIRVNAVGPGPTIANVHDGDVGMAHEVAGVPLQHAVSPQEIADAVLYLAEARSVTGQTLCVDSGQSIGWRTPDIVE